VWRVLRIVLRMVERWSDERPGWPCVVDMDIRGWHAAAKRVG